MGRDTFLEENSSHGLKNIENYCRKVHLKTSPMFIKNLNVLKIIKKQYRILDSERSVLQHVFLQFPGRKNVRIFNIKGGF